MVTGSYGRERDARRAAKKAFPEGNFEVVTNEDGKFGYRGLEIEITSEGEKLVEPDLQYAQVFGRAERVPETKDALEIEYNGQMCAPDGTVIGDVLEQMPPINVPADVFGSMFAQMNGEVRVATANVASRVHKLDDTHAGCPLCGAEDSDITYVEPNQASDDMRRECHSCGERFNRQTGMRIRAGHKVENAPRGHKIEKNLVVQNDVKRPSKGTLCRQVWDLCDEMKEQLGRPPTSKEIRPAGTAKGWNVNNVMIEFYQWRKFNGITSEKK